MTFTENRAIMEEIDPDDTYQWRKITSTRHRALAKIVRQAVAAAQEPEPQQQEPERQEFNASQIKQLFDGTDNLETAFTQAQSSMSVDDQTPLSMVESEVLFRQTSRLLSKTPGASAAEFDELHATVSRVLGPSAPFTKELSRTVTAVVDAEAEAEEDAGAEADTSFGSVQAGSPPGTPSATVAHPDASTVVNQQALLSRDKEMQALALEIGKQTAQSNKQTRGAIGEVTAAVMDTNDTLKNTRQYLSDTSADATAQMGKIEQLGVNNPKTAKLFERGLISVAQMQDKSFVQAMEQSLALKDERTGSLTAGSARPSQPGSYARMAPRPGGVYKYRRPHFSTSPLFADTAR